jgi:hypothetical protein
LLGGAYLVKGTFQLFTSASDFGLRSTESRYVFRGKNPLDVWQTYDASVSGVPAPVTTRDASIDPDLGPTYGAYPLWAYVITALVTWPDDAQVARVLNGLVSLALLLVVLRLTYLRGLERSRERAFLLVLSVFATSSICSTLGVGQSAASSSPRSFAGSGAARRSTSIGRSPPRRRGCGRTTTCTTT